MDTAINVLEAVFLYSSSSYITIHTFLTSPILGLLYVLFLVLFALGIVRLAPAPTMAFKSPLAMLNAFLYTTILLGKVGVAKDTASSTESFRSEFTVPASSNVGADLLPNIYDPEAGDAQAVCPGYAASNVLQTPTGMTALLHLAGNPCNLYGNDVDFLNLTVAYQAGDRLSVNIHPAYLNPLNSSWFILPEHLVPSPGFDAISGNMTLDNDMSFFWSNEPTFSFSVVRKSTGDVMFSTMGTKIIYEDQFIEFSSALPKNYNLYGLGESIHGLRLGNNFTKVYLGYTPNSSVG